MGRGKYGTPMAAQRLPKTQRPRAHSPATCTRCGNAVFIGDQIEPGVPTRHADCGNPIFTPMNQRDGYTSDWRTETRAL